MRPGHPFLVVVWLMTTCAGFAVPGCTRQQDTATEENAVTSLLQITICEKQQGRWKIVFQAFVRDPEHPDVVYVP